ncbi:MAG: hypothetical protein ACI4Q9_04965 [Candidatus Methanomethylophilaceae archaeon]
MVKKIIPAAVLLLTVLAAVFVCCDGSDAQSVEIPDPSEMVLDRNSDSTYDIPLAAGEYMIVLGNHSGSWSIDCGSGSVYSGGTNSLHVKVPSAGKCVISISDGPESLTVYVCTPMTVYTKNNNDTYTTIDLSVGRCTVCYGGVEGNCLTYMWANGTQHDVYSIPGLRTISMDAHSVYFESEVSQISVFIYVEPEEYNHKNLICKPTWSSNGSYSIFWLDSGTYQMKFSRDGQLMSGEDSILSFTAGVEQQVTISKSGSYCYRALSTGNPSVVYLNITPDVKLFDSLDDAEFSDVHSSTAYRWGVLELDLSDGHQWVYVYNVSQFFCFIKDSPQDVSFRTDVLDTGAIEANGYYGDTAFDSLGRDFNLKESSTVVVYYLLTSLDFVDNVSYALGDSSHVERVAYYKDTGPESLYASANVPLRIQADYDMSKYTMYLVSTNYQKVIESDVLVEVTCESAREFHILMKPLMSSGEDAYYCDYELYTEGVPEPDDNAPMFAGVCIGLCAVFFGLLLLSGRKPKW